MMGNDASGHFDVTSRRHVAGRRLDEEERLLWDFVVQFLGVFCIIPAYGHDLNEKAVSCGLYKLR